MKTIWQEREKELCTLYDVDHLKHESARNQRKCAIQDMFLMAESFWFPKRYPLLAIVGADACVVTSDFQPHEYKSVYLWCLALVAKLAGEAYSDMKSYIMEESSKTTRNVEHLILQILDYDLYHLESARLQFKATRRQVVQRHYSSMGVDVSVRLLDMAMLVFNSFHHPAHVVVDTCMALVVFIMEGASNLVTFLFVNQRDHLLTPCIQLLYGGYKDYHHVDDTASRMIDAKHILDTVSRMADLVSVKIALVGASGVGKSSLVNRIVRGKSAHLSEELTIAAAYAQCTLDKYKLLIWDTAGSERFQSFLPMYIRGAKIIIAVYDVTDPQSLDYVKREHNRLLADHSVPHDVVWFLVGNKTDVPESMQHVTHARGQAVADSWVTRSKWEQLVDSAVPIGHHMRVSAKSGVNVGRVTDTLVTILGTIDMSRDPDSSSILKLHTQDDATPKDGEKQNLARKKPCC